MPACCSALLFWCILNPKLLLLGVYFCSGLTSQPRPHSCCKAAAQELWRDCLGTATSQLIKNLAVSLLLCCDGFLDTFNPKITVDATRRLYEQGIQLGSLFSVPHQHCGFFLPGAGGANILPTTANGRQINTNAFQALMSRARLSPENNLPEIDT